MLPDIFICRPSLYYFDYDSPLSNFTSLFIDWLIFDIGCNLLSLFAFTRRRDLFKISAELSKESVFRCLILASWFIFSYNCCSFSFSCIPLSLSCLLSCSLLLTNPTFCFLSSVYCWLGIESTDWYIGSFCKCCR